MNLFGPVSGRTSALMLCYLSDIKYMTSTHQGAWGGGGARSKTSWKSWRTALIILTLLCCTTNSRALARAPKMAVADASEISSNLQLNPITCPNIACGWMQIMKDSSLMLMLANTVPFTQCSSVTCTASAEEYRHVGAPA